MSLNSEIRDIRFSMSLFRQTVLDSVMPDSPSYERHWEKYRGMKAEFERLVAERNANPIRHVKCEKPWSREFFGRFPGSYEFCDVLEMWLDPNDHMVSCLAQRKNGEQFFAVPKYGHFGQCNDYDLHIPECNWEYHRIQYQEMLQRICHL